MSEEASSSGLIASEEPAKPDRWSLSDKVALFFAEMLGPLVIRALGQACRYHVEGQHHLETAEAAGGGVILAIWHGRMLLPVYHLRGRGIISLASLHRDGEFIARIVRPLGYISRRGSPREGGRAGFNAMVRDLRAGRTVAIFPDGPTGPRHSVRDGVVQLARLTGAPIVPISFSAAPAWRAGSWDRFMVMKPFSLGVILMKEPFTIPRQFTAEQGLEYYRTQVRMQLLEVENKADSQMNVSG